MLGTWGKTDRTYLLSGIATVRVVATTTIEVCVAIVEMIVVADVDVMSVL
jgi:hypothetical protein